MSSDTAPVPKFACEKEASNLLNCIAGVEYVEQKCVTYMKRLRKCVQKERVVSFDLLPGEPAAKPDTAGPEKE